jgi:hypothetical protein
MPVLRKIFCTKVGDVLLPASRGVWARLTLSSDVRRKHTLSCEKNYDKEQVPILRRGRKPRACEACFHGKLSCDKETPCGRCVSRNLTCRFPDCTAKLPLSHLQQDAHSSLHSSRFTGRNTEMAFWRGLTKPQAETMLIGFINTQVMNDSIPETDFSLGPPGNTQSSLGDIFSLPWLYPQTSNNQVFSHELDYNDDTWIMSQSTSRDAVPALTDTGFITLTLLSKLIIRELYALHSILSVADPSYNQTFDLDLAQSVLAPHNLKSFTATYFRLAHLYIPVVHMPSFGTDETSTSLALAVALFGAAMSPPNDDALSAKGFLRLAEEYIFRNLADAVRASSMPERRALEVMQAALLVLNIHFLMNDIEARRRNRTRRLPALVLAVRHFDLYQTRHSPDASLSQFVRNENCIR